MTPADIEAVYDAMAQALDTAGAEKHSLLLAKLVLLLARDLGARDLVLQRIAEAGLNLDV